MSEPTNEPQGELSLAEGVVLIQKLLEVHAAKDELWQRAVYALCKKYHVAEEDVFAEVEEGIREKWAEVERTPGYGAVVQDALYEFRSAARQLLERANK